MLNNGSFEDGWDDVGTGTPLINQQPRGGWGLSWAAIGDELPGSSDVARGIPECVHKHKNQLPPHQQLGQPGALILEGEFVYKIFHAGASFGAKLEQTITGLEPGSPVELTVPVNLHRHNDADPWSAEVGVFVNDSGSWVNSLPDDAWVDIPVNATADADGNAIVEIFVKSKWDTPKDFFIDNITFVGTPATDPPPDGQELAVDIPSWATKVVFKE